MLRRALLVLPLLALACQPAPAAEQAPASTPALAQTPTQTPVPASPPAPEFDQPEPAPASPDEAELEPASTLAEPPPELAEPEPEALADELAKGPEPGSPESDAELLALLDDSTLTQDEFAKAFGSGKDPKITEDGQLSFGAGDRSRERSKVSVGAATLGAGKAKPADLEALARADLHDLETCHAMALSKDPAALGRVVLTIDLGSQGAVEQVAVTSTLGSSLGDCLASVAKTWTLAGAGKATLDLPLSLSTQ